MKNTFSTHWKASKKPNKQRKYVFNAPLHTKGHFLHAHVAKELRTEVQSRSLRVRKGDKVKVMRGQFRSTIGVVDRVDVRSSRLYIAKVEIIKKDGSKSAYPIHPSNVLLLELKKDKRRLTSAKSTQKADKQDKQINSSSKKQTAKTETPKAVKKTSAQVKKEE